MPQKYPMTLEGKEQLEKELIYLKEDRQKEINEEIKRLRKFCDFEEDMCFTEMLEQQSLVRERIKNIEEILHHLELVDHTDEQSKSTIIIGSTVEFMELPDGVSETYTIVSPIESNPSKGKISVESPIGKGLLGHTEKEELWIDTPSGEIKIKILSVS